MVSSLKHLQSSYLVWEEHHSPQLLACSFFIFLSPSGWVREQPCHCHRPTLSSVLPDSFCPPSRITQDEVNLLNPLKSAWFWILFHRYPCVFCFVIFCVCVVFLGALFFQWQPIFSIFLNTGQLVFSFLLGPLPLH